MSVIYGVVRANRLRIYLDASPVIYAVERVAPYFDYLETLLFISGNTLVASELTRLEARVKPVREGNRLLISQFDAFFGQTVDEIAPLTREVMDKATLIRAQYGFRTPDAIHLGAAMTSRCDVFLTNDDRISRFGGMSVEMIGGNLQG
ncbi:MAG: type II toxin-antitoxin system VapC family toxin [Chloroflexi bacterium]|nr:type II toxin-antitoxin system VapC family toxin [Chloroflexota bacterium]